MCGIIGYKSKNNISFDKLELIRSIRHRGPDSSKYIEIKKKNNLKTNVFLGFSRLSIIDDNVRSDQPFKYKNLIICFNGEIYNFKLLKKELIREKKIKFSTNSDTEVLIKLIYHIGLKKTLEKIEGMWAFSLYDTKAEKLTLCRDRFGEKPLLYLKKKIIFFLDQNFQFLQFF